jgi:S1-C subfamily serine protease
MSLIIVAMARAQEAATEGVRRLTFEQHIKVTQTNRPKLQKAYMLLQEGKPAEAIPIVKEIIDLERQVLKEAASNPIEVERPQSADALARGPLGLGRPGGRGVSGVPDDLLRGPPHAPTLRAFQAESLRSLELLEQLHEALGDYKAARGVSEEVAGIVATLVGERTWQVRQAREDTRRLDRLASLDGDRLRAIESARKATALVATARGALGTAFCIDPQGLFLTLDEVASPPSVQVTPRVELDKFLSDLSGTREERSPKTLPMTVVLNLGGRDVKQLPVRVLWRDEATRLVLLKAASREPLPALELAGRGAVAPGQEAVALGLAFVGGIPGLAASPTPTVRARPGRVASVRERRGEPWFYQIDSTPPPGYSGGPVLDARGRVIGVIAGGLPGTDIHYVLPLDATTPSLGQVAPDFEPPPLPYRDRHAPADWAVRLFSKRPVAKDVAVEFRLGTGTTARSFPARPTGERVYTARVVPVAVGETDPVELTLEMGLERVRQTVADRDVRIGATTVRLSELRRVEPGPSPRALTVDGRRLAGPVTGLGALDGGRAGPRDGPGPGRAPTIRIQCPSPGAEPIEVEVVVKEGGKVLGRVRKTLGYADPPFEATRRIDPTRVGPIDGPRPGQTPDVPMAAASVKRGPTDDTGAPGHPLPPLVRRLPVRIDSLPPAAGSTQPAFLLVRPKKIASVAVGGAGRFLLLQLGGQRRLAVFDAQRADFSGFVELADDDALITANAEKGFVAYPKLRLIDRIDLESARIERSSAFLSEVTPRVLLAGSSSAGPLFSIFHAGRADDSFAQPVLGFLDPDTMGLIAPRMFRRRGEKGWAEAPGPVLAASNFGNGEQADYSNSPSGDLFCFGVSSPSLVFALNGDVAEVFETPHNDPGCRPAISWRSLVTRMSRFDLDGSRLAYLPDPAGILDVIPSQDPAYYLVVRSEGQAARPGTMPRPFLEVVSAASDRRLFVVDGLDEMSGPMNNELTLGQRYHLIPSARLIVTIPAEGDRLVVRRLDILGEVRRLAIDEIIVTSPPVVGAVAGEPFRHRVEAYTKGGATFERSDGPEGLSVSPEGELRWDVPRADAGREEVATITVRSASGQKVLHRLHILIRGRG